MLEMKITITASELAEAINNLANALSAGGTKVIPQTPEEHTENPIPTAPGNSTPQPNAWAAQTAPSATTVPTAAPQYTLDMIATAGSALIDAGKLDQLMALLDRYGVDNITKLRPETYGAVAAELRALGARI